MVRRTDAADLRVGGDGAPPEGKPSDDIVAEIDAGAEDISDVLWWDYPILAVFWGLMIVVFLQFFSRYVFNNSITWTEEIARYLLIVLAFTGSLVCIRKRSHIHLEVVLDRLPDRVAQAFRILGDAVTAVFFGGLAWTGIALARRMDGQRLISVDLSRGVFYWIVVTSLAAGALLLLVRLVRFRGRR